MNQRVKYSILMLIFLCGNASANNAKNIVKTVKLPAKNIHYQLLDESDDNGSDAVGKYYRISIDGGATFGKLRKHNPVIELKHHRFDPLDKPSGLVDGNGAITRTMHLVQFDTKLIEAYKEVLSDVGAEIVGYIPRQTVVVKAGSASAQNIRNLSFVRWVGPYKKQYKISPSILKKLEDSNKKPANNGSTQRYIASLFSTSDDDLEELSVFLKSIDAQLISKVSEGSKFLHLNLNNSQLGKLADFYNIQYIEPWSEPEDDMDVVRNVSGADFLEIQVPWYTGVGVTGEVMDGGLRITHNDFSDVVLHGNNNTSTGHGTPVYGIVFGDGTSDATARGVLPDGIGVFASYFEVNNRAAHTAELVDPMGNFRAVFQTNSWGNARTTDYTNISSEIDQIIFDNDILILQSQSNAGTQMSRPQAWAKNIVSVGGIRHENTADLADDNWTSGASIGPAADGRIKPDLSHFYDDTWTTDDDADNDYRNFGGTSGATPITAGHFGLFFQMWADGIFNGTGTPGGGNNVFDARPHASTAKAFMINTALQYDFNGEDHDLTRVHQGWGLANVENLYTIAENNQWRFPLVVNEDDLLTDQATNTYTIYVTDTENSWLKATMAYMDPPGDPVAAIATVNDLTLQIISPSGVEYWGNVGLLAGNWSTPGGDANEVDTVENIFIENAEEGTWTINVIADSIVEDSHIETTAVDADYALVVSCAGSNRCSTEASQPEEENYAWLIPVISLILN